MEAITVNAIQGIWEMAFPVLVCIRILGLSQKYISMLIYFIAMHIRTDINECETDPCNGTNALCINNDGSFYCDCHPGYTGDGYQCTG